MCACACVCASICFLFTGRMIECKRQQHLPFTPHALTTSRAGPDQSQVYRIPPKSLTCAGDMMITHHFPRHIGLELTLKQFQGLWPSYMAFQCHKLPIFATIPAPSVIFVILFNVCKPSETQQHFLRKIY